MQRVAWGIMPAASAYLIEGMMFLTSFSPQKIRGDIYSLELFNLIHQFTYVGRNWVHAQAVKTTIKHVSLNACFIKNLVNWTNCFFIRIFSKAGSTCSKLLHSSLRGQTTHLDDQWSNTYQLIYTRLILSWRLPHVAVDQAEFNLLFICFRLKGTL